ncbi:MAG TPA: N-acetylmuramoyl-L-alanine amidase CwlD [Clostridiales bacterium]|nr:N-acetylmuramoyl-L-alanine amidase CwlD [Clostridiales bacterium]
MKYLYLSRNKLFLLWALVGIGLILIIAAQPADKDMLAVFSSPADNKVIVIDPGHGGIDSGAVSPSGTREDELNLKVAMKLKQYLTNHNATVIMTRETNEGLAARKSEDMRKRVELIKNSNADIVISIHMNKFPQSKYFGAQTFYMAGSEKGKKLAVCIQTKLVENLIEGNNRKIKPADNLVILKASSAPSVIVECGFLSNAKEEALLKTDEYQEKIAWSIFSGIIEYFATEDTFQWDGMNTPSLLSIYTSLF